MMKKQILTILLILVSMISHAGITYSTFNIPGYGNCNLVIYTPDGTLPNQKLKTCVFIPGNGEAGSNINAMFVHGPLRFIRDHGWKPDFMVVGIQPLHTWPNRVVMRYALNHLVANNNNFDLSCWFPTGLSAGAGCIFDYMRSEPDSIFRKPIAVVPFSITIDAQCGNFYTNTDSLCGTDLRYANVPAWGLAGWYDSHYGKMKRFFERMIQAGYNTRWTTYKLPIISSNQSASGHCCWNTYYDPSYKENGKNIYEWAFQFCGLTSLPVQLLSFQVQDNRSRMLLTWKVANETDFSHYDVERSSNGISWGWISRITGTNQSIYQCLDMQPLHGTSYYRLKMVDRDGRYKYSPVRVVHKQSETVDVEVYSLIGNLLGRYRSTTVDEVKQMYSSAMPGVYMIKIISKGTYTVEKFLVHSK